MALKIVCFTDNMGSGGAQRQLSFLAVLLRQKGYEVIVCTYNNGSFFDKYLSLNNILRYRVNASSKIGRIFAFLQFLKFYRPDVVIAFQETPSLISELASLFCRRHKLIVSERQAIPLDLLPRSFRFFKWFHRFAEHITTNSHTNYEQLVNLFPEFRSKASVIYNAVDLTKFSPNQSVREISDCIKLIVFASHKPQKNFKGLLLGLSYLKKNYDCPNFEIHWYGDEAPGQLAVDQSLLQDHGLGDCLKLHPATIEVDMLLKVADALINPSLWEGLPNTVCEALACGCPVLMSDVCDARDLVKNGVNGFLFDPHSPESVAQAIFNFISLDSTRCLSMREEARSSALCLFDPENFVRSYERLVI